MKLNLAIVLLITLVGCGRGLSQPEIKATQAEAERLAEETAKREAAQATCEKSKTGTPIYKVVRHNDGGMYSRYGVSEFVKCIYK